MADRGAHRTDSSRRNAWLLIPAGALTGLVLGVFAWQAQVEANPWVHRVAECADECPDGTIRTSYEKVVTGKAAVITGYRCETYCEALLPCPPPNVPTIVKVGGENEYSCAPLQGFSTIPAPGDIDFSFAQGWTP